MEKLGVKLGYGDDGKYTCKEIVHVLALPYPAQGHIVPLMQLCRKLASEEGVMVTFVNTMHNHARMLQAELAAGTREAQYESNFNNKYTTNIDSTTNTCTSTKTTTTTTSSCTCTNSRFLTAIDNTHAHNTTINTTLNCNPTINHTKITSKCNPIIDGTNIPSNNSITTTLTSTLATTTQTHSNSNSDALSKDYICGTTTTSNTYNSSDTNGNHNQHNISKLCKHNCNTNNSTGTNGSLHDSSKANNNIRLVGIPGGLPPELHVDPAHIVAVFQASEALYEPLEKLIEKLNQEGPPVSCIISDVLVSWTQECAEKVGIPRFAFWTSSAAVYHVIWHMYGLISQGIPTFKEANTIFEDNNTEMVSCIPGLPPMDLNDLPIIVRSDPADFIYQFLTRQLKPMERAAAVLLNTFYELEEHCLQALPATSPVPIYSIGPLLPPQVMLQANVDGKFDGASSNGGHADKRKPAEYMSVVKIMEKYKHAADEHVPMPAISVPSNDGKVDGQSINSGGKFDGESAVKFSSGGKFDGESVEDAVKSSSGESEDAVKDATRKAVKTAEKALLAAGKAVAGDGKAVCVDEKAGGKALCAENAVRRGSTKAAGYSSVGIFDEDGSCLEWLDKKEACSVLYISFGSIFAMSVEQFTELVEGLQASKQAFLWAIRPGFVQGFPSYTHTLPPSFLENTKDRGMLVSWVPQLAVLAHPAVGGFLTHCGWNSTLESVALGVPMLCWPDVGERRTNGRLAVSLWKAGLEFSCSASVHMNGLLISREEVKHVILKLMDPCSPTASHLRSRAASLQMSAHRALSHSGSSSHDWNLFLHHIHHPPKKS